MKSQVCVILLLGLALGQTFAAQSAGRILLGESIATSSASSTGGGFAQSVSNAASKGDVRSIADSIAKADSGGEATAISNALADQYRRGSKKEKDAIAKALAEATDLSEDGANKALQDGATNVAEAIATSRGGTTEAQVRAISEATSESKDAVAKALVEAYSKVNGGGDALSEANVAAKAIGRATASAYARVQVNLRVTGDGEAEGYGDAAARAYARATATVIAEGVAVAANKFNKGKAQLKVEAVVTAIARASASAFAEGIQIGKGTVNVNQESLSNAVAEPIADVVFSVLAVTYGKELETAKYVERADTSIRESTDSQSTTTSDSSGQGGSGQGGGAASASVRGECDTSIVFRCCGDRLEGKNEFCRCRRRRGCDAERHKADSNGYTIEWKVAKTGKICGCPPRG